MKKFQFPLAKVLEYDTHLQKNESDALSLLQAEYNRLEKKRNDMLAEYDLAKKRYQAECESGQSASRAVAAGMYITDQRQQINKVSEQMREQLRKIDKQRERLVAVTQDKTMIEKLKERSQEAYRITERKSDELYIAELVSNQAAKVGN